MRRLPFHYGWVVLAVTLVTLATMAGFRSASACWSTRCIRSSGGRPRRSAWQQGSTSCSRLSETLLHSYAPAFIVAASLSLVASGLVLRITRPVTAVLQPA